LGYADLAAITPNNARQEDDEEPEEFKEKIRENKPT
jgi:hypothetical protein